LILFYSLKDFKLQFPSTHVILDGTEIPIKKLSNPVAQLSTFSTHKKNKYENCEEEKMNQQFSLAPKTLLHIKTEERFRSVRCHSITAFSVISWLL